VGGGGRRSRFFPSVLKGKKRLGVKFPDPSTSVMEEEGAAGGHSPSHTYVLHRGCVDPEGVNKPSTLESPLLGAKTEEVLWRGRDLDSPSNIGSLTQSLERIEGQSDVRAIAVY
jgi:hypothetical protein